MTREAVVIRTLIVDDEAGARRTIRRLLEHDPDIELVGEASGPESVDRIRQARPDLVLMDIHMPGMDGFDILQALEPDELPLVVFVTAHDEHALRAFELRALDYLVKPYADSRLLEAVGRAKDRIRSRETEAAQRRLLQLLRSRLSAAETPPAAGGPAEGVRTGARAGRAAAVAVRDGSRIVVLRPEEVVWIEAAGSYCRIHLESGSELIRTSLGTLEDQLDPERFFRIHRSAIVALDRVQEVRHESHGDYMVVLRDGTELKLTRSRKEEFELRVGLG